MAATDKNIDLKLTPDKFGLFDISVEDDNFASVEGLDSAIYTSLFTDGRAPAYNVPESFRRRGWIGNVLSAKIPTSLLWLLDQSRLTQETTNLAKLYAEESLQWMLDEKIAKNFEVQVFRESRGIMVQIDLIGFNDQTNRFYVLWQRTGRS